MLSGNDFGIGFAVGFPVGVIFTALVARFWGGVVMQILWSWAALANRWNNRKSS